MTIRAAIVGSLAPTAFLGDSKRHPKAASAHSLVPAIDVIQDLSRPASRTIRDSRDDAGIVHHGTTLILIMILWSVDVVQAISNSNQSLTGCLIVLNQDE